MIRTRRPHAALGSLDDPLAQLARRLAEFTGLLSLITRPRHTTSRLHAIRLVASGERLSALLVKDATNAQHHQRAPSAR